MLADLLNGGNDGGNSDGLGGIQMVGLVNALKTGNVVLDMIIAMTVPVILKLLFHTLSNLHSTLSKVNWMSYWWRDKNKTEHERRITYKQTKTQYGSRSDDEDSQNQVLIKAIQLYAHMKGNMQLKVADLSLTSLAATGVSNGDDYDYYDDYYDGRGQEGNTSTMYGILSGYSIVKSPPRGSWHVVGNFGKGNVPVKIMSDEHNAQEDSEGEGGGGPGSGRDNNNSKSSHATNLHVRSQSQEAIDSFISEAYNWYLEQIKSLEDDSRYMYELKSDDNLSSGYGSRSSNQRRQYKRFKLSDEKTFDSLFFQEKERLLEIVDHFVEKSGKYAIKGYPHKLGLLLHGPPGSGKTSRRELARRSAVVLGMELEIVVSITIQAIITTLKESQ